MVVLVITFVFFILFLSYCLVVRNQRKIYGKLSAIPGPKPVPLFGNALQLKRDSHEFYKQIIDWSIEFQNDGLIVVWIGLQPVIVVFTPEYTEVVLSSQRNITKSYLYTFLHSWLGTGLLTSTGEKWKYRRRLLTPTFHFKILNDFLSIHQKHATKLVDLLQERVGKKEFNIVPYLSLCVLDIICETSMGIDIHAQFGQNSEYISSVFSICELIQERQKSPWLWPDFIYNLLYQGKLTKKYLDILHNFTNRVIDNRIKNRHEEKHSASETTQHVTNSKRHILAFLDLLLEQYDEGNITREGISEEVDTFMFEGHDTTAASLQWVIHLIAVRPQVQQRLHKEVDDFFASVSDSGDISPDQLKNLIYVECAIKEALRLFPSVPLLGREVTHDCKLGEYDIPKGCNVFVAPMALHLHPNVWKDPLIFNPDRFLPGRNHGRNPFAYVPFSAGPRNCIGQKFALMEEKIVIATILRNFKIFSTQVTQGIRKSPDIILNSADGVMITLERRETCEN